MISRRWLLICLVLIVGRTSLAQTASDGRRAVRSERYGIATRVPAAWRLIDWSRDDKAFVLKLPQDPGSKTGYVSCELGVAPESLDDFRKRIDDSAASEAKQGSTTRTLTENRVEMLKENVYGKKLVDQLGQRLTSSWEIADEDDNRSLEVCCRVVHDGTLYTFRLSSDEAHYEAYRLDFEDMLKACEFSTPETGLRKMAGGYWMQRDFRFALKLPDGWRPAFGPNDRVLFFATGEAHEVFTDNLIVLASQPLKLDLPKMKESLPGEISKADGVAKVECSIVPQGGTAALETIIRTRRGPLEVTILERRFSSRSRNYEVKFTCESAKFKEIEAELRKTLDSFAEVVDDGPRGDV